MSHRPSVNELEGVGSLKQVRTLVGGSQEEIVFTSPVGLFPEVRYSGQWDSEASRQLSLLWLGPRMTAICWQKVEQVRGSSSWDISWVASFKSWQSRTGTAHWHHQLIRVATVSAGPCPFLGTA